MRKAVKRFGSLIRKPDERDRGSSSSTAALAYWQSKKGDDRRILYGTFDGRLIALDAKTGEPCSDFAKDGVVNLRTGIADGYPGAEYSVTSPPAIYQDLVIIGAAVPEYPSRGPSGVVRAFDVRSGKLVWTFHTIPQPAEVGHESWTEMHGRSVPAGMSGRS